MSDLTWDKNSNEHPIWQPNLYLDTRPKVQAVIGGSEKIFYTDDFQVQQYKFYLTGLNADEKYYIVATAGEHYSNEFSFKTLDE
jgi:hypothetical protein